MISTEGVPAAVHTLLDDLLEQAMRARQRRVLTADHPGMHLGALAACDALIDRTVRAASLHGPAARQRLDARIADSPSPPSPAAIDAAVFLRVSLAVQMQERSLAGLVQRHVDTQPRAVYDALRFMPVPATPFQLQDAHIVQVFVQAERHPQWLPWALRLAGERDVKTLQPRIEALLRTHAAEAHLALACMDRPTPATGPFVDAALLSGDPARIADGLRIAAVAPALATDLALVQGLDPLPAGHPAADVAWGLLATRHPQAALAHARTRAGLPPALWLRLVALTGCFDAVLDVCAGLAAQPESISAAQADVLTLALGQVPAELRVRPGNPATRSQALRALVLRTCRQCHLGVRPGAEQIDSPEGAETRSWTRQHLLAEPAAAGTLRLRQGRPLAAGMPPLGPWARDVTHGLRQWLYLERAATGGRALALSAWDVARRQDLALAVAALDLALHDGLPGQ